MQRKIQYRKKPVRPLFTGLAPCSYKPTRKQNIRPFKLLGFFSLKQNCLFALFARLFFFKFIYLGYGSDPNTPLFHIRMSLATAIGGGHVIFLAGIDATGNKMRRYIYSKLSLILSFVV